ncbi:MAG: CoA binding domain protein [Methanobacterium sp. PtaU1.Bin242]|nr:MAG: CoA binding domain protein [Methanobacterium sp. PtaU1.Bin242]
MELKNKIIAIVGVSDDYSKYGHKIFRDLLRAKYNVEGINPKGGFILGKIIYKSLKELPKKPDMIITVVPPAITENIVEECRELAITHIWMQPGSESQNAIDKAKEYGIKVTTACFMINQNLWT